jgi:Sec7-like guanine-nucleotide exchange factor
LAFNKKPVNAIDDYITKGIIPDEEPKSIAEYLLSIEGLDKTVLGEYFGKNNESALKILREYCILLNFKDMEFDLALRKLLSKFRLPGEAQQIERVIW